VVHRIGDVEVPGCIRRHPFHRPTGRKGVIELRADGLTAVSRSARRSIARIGADGSGGVHLAHAIVADIRDEEVTGAVHRQTAYRD
jgi:hypothetical protein